MGIPLYGKTFNLKSATNNGVKAETIGTGIAGPYSATSGTLFYYEICPQRSQNVTEKYDHIQEAPYIVNGDQWITYDNEM